MKTMYRREGGKVIGRKVSDAQADEMSARGWLPENPDAEAIDEKPKRRGRPPKKVASNDDQA